MAKIMEKIKNVPWGYFLFTIVTILVGICFVVFTTQSINVMCYVIGGVTILAALVIAIFTLAKKERGATFFLHILLCVLAAISGVVMMVSKESSLEWIVAVVNLILIIDAAFKLQTIISLKGANNAFWWTMLVFVIVALSGNAYLIKFYDPNRCQLMVGVLGGLLIVDGILNCLTPIFRPLIEKANREWFEEEHAKVEAMKVELEKEKAAEEQKKAEEKAAEEQKKAEEKAAEKQKKEEEKAAEEQKKAEEKAAEKQKKAEAKEAKRKEKAAEAAESKAEAKKESTAVAQETAEAPKQEEAPKKDEAPKQEETPVAEAQEETKA